jgi:hypothetical protein
MHKEQHVSIKHACMSHGTSDNRLTTEACRLNRYLKRRQLERARRARLRSVRRMAVSFFERWIAAEEDLRAQRHEEKEIEANQEVLGDLYNLDGQLMALDRARENVVRLMIKETQRVEEARSKDKRVRSPAKRPPALPQKIVPSPTKEHPTDQVLGMRSLSTSPVAGAGGSNSFNHYSEMFDTELEGIDNLREV